MSEMENDLIEQMQQMLDSELKVLTADTYNGLFRTNSGEIMDQLNS